MFSLCGGATGKNDALHRAVRGLAQPLREHCLSAWPQMVLSYLGGHAGNHGPASNRQFVLSRMHMRPAQESEPGRASGRGLLQKEPAATSGHLPRLAALSKPHHFCCELCCVLCCELSFAVGFAVSFAVSFAGRTSLGKQAGEGSCKKSQRPLLGSSTPTAPGGARPDEQDSEKQALQTLENISCTPRLASCDWARAATLKQYEEPPWWTREDLTDGAPKL